MDNVPFLFCESVVHILHDLTNFESLRKRSPCFGHWWAAITQANVNRSTFELRISLKNGEWSYSLISNRHLLGSTDYEHFLAANTKYAHVRTIVIGSDARYKSSQEEVMMIVMNTLQYVNKPSIELYDCSEFPESTLSGLLDLYGNSPALGVDASLYNEVIDKFLQSMIRADLVKGFRIEREGWSKDLVREILKFLLTKPYTNVQLRTRSVQLNKDFFVAVMKKQLTCKKCCFSANCDFPLEELRSRIPELRVLRDWQSQRLHWERGDGVTMSGLLLESHFTLTFQRL